MSLIREDGTGLADANAYADLDRARAFHTDRGSIGAWSDLESNGTAAGGLLSATVMLDSRYAWRGVILNPDQGLRLPRVAFYDPDGRLVTPEAQIARAADACSLLALRLLEDPAGGANIVSEQFPMARQRSRMRSASARSSCCSRVWMRASQSANKR